MLLLRTGNKMLLFEILIANFNCQTSYIKKGNTISCVYLDIARAGELLRDVQKSIF
jgi:hypothetical protein